MDFETRQRQRFALLRQLYEMAGGVASKFVLDIAEAGRSINLSREDALDTYEYLRAEGLTEWAMSGGHGTISHWGVKEVEAAQQEKPSAHFPANIVMIVNSPGAQGVAGADNTVHQHATVTVGDSVAQLRRTLETVASPLPPEAEAVLDQAERGEEARFDLPRLVHTLAAKGGEWRDALAAFVNEASPGVASNLLVEFVKYGLGSG